jgi:phage terminase large subunit
MFQYTTAIKKLRRLDKRIRVVPGGTSAGKTYGILPILINEAATIPNLEISVVSESIPHLRRGALKDFMKIMKDTGRWIPAHYNKTFLTYTFSNGSYLEFFSADQEAKVKGARRHILYVNECDNITFAAYHQMAIRTSGTIWLDFNPTNEFWVHTELAEDPDAEWLTLTYLDNEALEETIIQDLEKAREKAKESSYWANWWKVYGLGQLGVLEGVIFNNWQQIDALPAEARLIGYALDFGYTNDPSTLIAAYQHNNRIIWDELLYETKLTNGEIAKRMKKSNVRSSDFIVADSAEPKSIAEINEHGFRVRGAVKGRDSINFGIDVLQENDFLVTSRSTNLIKELRLYAWATDKAGKSLNVPIDAFNHCIDPMRYLATAKISKQKKNRKGIKRRN